MSVADLFQTVRYCLNIFRILSHFLLNLFIILTHLISPNLLFNFILFISSTFLESGILNLSAKKFILVSFVLSLCPYLLLFHP